MSLAEGKVRIAMERLVHRYPFHAALLGRMRVTADPAVDKMAVAAAGRELVLSYEPAFVCEITLPELGGVLLHEVNHVILGHLFLSPENYPDAWALATATELTANEYVAEPLPGEPVTLEDFPGLPPGESTADRYLRLASISDDSRREVATLDDHTAWAAGGAEGGPDPEQAKAAARRAVADALALAEPADIPEDLRPALKALIGHEPGAGVESVSRGRPGVLDWRRLLRRYVGQALEVRRVFTRPPRRFPELIGVVPGRGRRRAWPRVMAVVDTSGSIRPDLLTLINEELIRLARHHEVLIVEADCVLQRVYSYVPLTGVKGGGGTDLRPALERSFLRQHRCDLVLYFTDGFSAAPDRPRAVPVIWVLVPGGEAPVSWGKQIHIHG
jgi:predicted metal-dependent peptidase